VKNRNRDDDDVSTLDRLILVSFQKLSVSHNSKLS